MGKNNKNLWIKALAGWFFIAIVFLFLACSRTNSLESADGHEVVAVINGNDIKVKELRNEMKFLEKQFRVRGKNELTPEESFVLKTDALNQLIQNVLLNSEVLSNGIFLERDEYTQALNKVVSDHQDDSFPKYLEMGGISKEAWESRFKNNMLLKKLINDVVNSKVAVSDDQMKEYYDDHHAEFQKGEQVRSLHIMVDSESKILDILKQLKTGKRAFSELAQMYSLGPEGPLGGDLGYFEAGQMPEEFDGVFKLKVGQVSDSIKTPFGHHIFKVIDKKPASEMNFSESKKVIFNKLLREKQSREFNKWIVKLKDMSDIKIKHHVLSKVN